LTKELEIKFLSNFTGMNSRTDNGAMFENFIFLELKSFLDKKIFIFPEFFLIL